MGFLDFLDSMFGLAPKDKVAPVIQSPADRETDKDYRYADDPAFVIRVEQKFPEGMPKKVSADVDIDGLFRANFKEAVAGFILGEKRRIKLAVDDKSKSEPKPVKVIGAWKDHKGNSQEGQLGWLPNRVMPEIEIFLKKPLGGTVKFMSKPRKGGPPKITIDIWRSLKGKKTPPR